MQDAPKAVWSIPYISVAFFPSLKQNFIAYRSSKVSSHPDCIFEIHKLWQSGFSRVYSNSCCSCSFEADIIKIGQSSYKMYNNNILNFQESMDNFKCLYKKSLETYWMHRILYFRNFLNLWVVWNIIMILFFKRFFFLNITKIQIQFLIACWVTVIKNYIHLIYFLLYPIKM